MSQYNKTVLTNAGLELAKRANAGQAKFEITRAVTSADDWSNKTVQDIEAVTAIPNIMQQGTIIDTEEVESNNSVMGVSLCFTNKGLSAGYQIKIMGVYAKEEGQDKDFLYAVTTAVAPEYMPDFNDEVLYRFNMQMYLVIGKAQAVNVVINDGASVTHRQFDNYKNEVTANLKKIENTHKEDMSHVAKSASINGGAEILPDSTGKLNLAVPAPDLSKYVSLEQLGELLQAKADVADVDSKIKTVTDLSNTKANSADVYTKTETDNQINKFDLSKVKFRKQYINGDGDKADKTWSATKNDDGTYTIDLYNDDWTASKLHDVLEQLPSKADTSTVNAQIADAKNTIKSDIDNLHNDLQNQINANDQGTIVTGYDWNTGTATNESRSLQNAWIVDQTALRGAVNRMNDINSNVNGRLSLDGGNMNLRSTINWTGGNIDDRTGNLGGLNWAGATDWAKIYADQDDNDNLDLAIDLGDDGSNHVSFRKNGSETSAITSDGHFTGTVDWSNVSGRPDVTPIVSGAGGDDLFAFKSNQIRLYPGNGRNCKNLPPASNTQWFTVQYVFENPNGDGIAIFRSPANEVWTIGNNGGAYTTHWVKLANSNDISDLQNQIQQLRDNQFEVQTFTDATAAANWEAQKPGKRMAIVNS